MGLHKQYMRVGQSAKNSLFGITPDKARRKTTTPRTLQMLISQQGKIKHSRLSLILFGIFTLILGIILTSVPWLDYLILKNLRLWNGTLSFHYWQKPGVIRLTKVYIFNITNNDSFINYGEKPKLQEIGPFVYREDMEKINIKFHENYTVSYQHKKILKFVPEMSVNKDVKLVVPNIPLLSLSTLSNHLGFMIQKTISLVLTIGAYKPFVSVTADELVFGYDDTLVALAHRFYPRNKRPASKMGLLITRNGTLKETHTVYTGHNMSEFGLLDRLNGLDHLPYWKKSPCNAIRASEGSFFPPRDVTGKNITYVYDKDLCRILPLEYRGPVIKNGINADMYTPPDNVFNQTREENRCFQSGNCDNCVPSGLQYIGPCQSDAPIYISFPHFYQADPELLSAVEGLKPEKEKHQTYFKIQPKLGVPVEGRVRVQLNIKVERARNVETVKNFPSIVYPIMWIEEGIEELTPEIRTWIYLATRVGEVASPALNYGMIVTGIIILVTIFIRAYKDIVFSKETIEIGMKNLRRRSSLLLNSSTPRLLIVRDSYLLLNSNTDEQV